MEPLPRASAVSRLDVSLGEVTDVVTNFAEDFGSLVGAAQGRYVFRIVAIDATVELGSLRGCTCRSAGW
jgi:hypothetical protein